MGFPKAVRASLERAIRRVMTRWIPQSHCARFNHIEVLIPRTWIHRENNQRIYRGPTPQDLDLCEQQNYENRFESNTAVNEANIDKRTSPTNPRVTLTKEH